MPLHPTWTDIALRLLLAAVAGAAVGFNREERSQAAGLRTNVLICAAAALAGILANILLGTIGKTPTSFVQIDVMRLPLGILSGIGFIGAGAIIKRQDIVVGVTTAATLWFMTVVGICIGTGQLWLGVGGAAVATALLWLLRRVDEALPRKLRGCLTVKARRAEIDPEALREKVSGAGYKVIAWAATYDREVGRYEVQMDLRWSGKLADRAREPGLVQELLANPGVLEAGWVTSPVGG